MSQTTKTIIIVISVALGLLILVSLVSGGNSGWNGGMMGGGGWWFLMPVFMIGVTVLVIWAIVAAVQGAGSPGRGGCSSHDGESPLDVLKKRYARGEISKEEFEKKKKDMA